MLYEKYSERVFLINTLHQYCNEAQETLKTSCDVLLCGAPKINGQMKGIEYFKKILTLSSDCLISHNRNKQEEE